MNKRVRQLGFLFLVVAMSLTACKQKPPKDGRTDTYTTGTVAIAADESFQPIVQEEIDVFESLYPEADIIPHYVTEVEAVNLLLKDSLRLVIASRKLTPEEKESFHSRKFFPRKLKSRQTGWP